MDSLMKIKLIFAYLLFGVGTANIIDWFIFWEQNKELALRNRNIFIAKYIERFPNFFKPLFDSNFLIDALLSILIFIISGIIFLKEKKVVYTILAIVSFIFAFLNLFSLM
jgi:hypothetical protein